MNNQLLKKEISSKIIRGYRPEKTEVKVTEPYMFLHEREIQKNGRVESVNTIFLTKWKELLMQKKITIIIGGQAVQGI